MNKVNLITITLLIIILAGLIYSIDSNRNFQQQTQTNLNRILFYLGDSRCLELSIIYWEKHKNLTLVYGWMNIMEGVTGSQGNHYWLESENKVYDALFKTSYDKQFYYSFFEVKAIQRYGYEQSKKNNNYWLGKIFSFPE